MEGCTTYQTSLSLILPVYKVGRLTYFLQSTVLRILQGDVQKAIPIMQMLNRHYFSTHFAIESFISLKLFPLLDEDSNDKPPSALSTGNK